MDRVAVFWFRRDLRLDDNAGLCHAINSGLPVLPLFIFDTEILDGLEDATDRRVDFIWQALKHIQHQLEMHGSTLKILHGKPEDCFKLLLTEYNISAVYTNHDYEPYARRRDSGIADYLHKQGLSLYTHKDQVVFEKQEILKDNGEPYTIFTPYSKKWKETVNDSYLKPYPCEKYFDNFHKQPAIPFPALSVLGFEETGYKFQLPDLDESIAMNYDKTRDTPSIHGTTRLSVHLRFGTISIRFLVAKCATLNKKLLDELIWREFYQMILWHFPHIVNTSFHAKYDNIEWRNNEQEFEKWKLGQTGYPIVDAGMHELNETGFMHNRLRMITASFLTKHLLIDWRWGEAYFAQKLLDYDLASNNGGWQWAAGTGCDAVPYFRVFNPYLQTQKFDPQYEYIKKWVPEYNEPGYPPPIIEHSAARERYLKVCKAALAK